MKEKSMTVIIASGNCLPKINSSPCLGGQTVFILHRRKLHKASPFKPVPTFTYRCKSSQNAPLPVQKTVLPTLKVMKLIRKLRFLPNHFRGLFLQVTSNKQKSDSGFSLSMFHRNGKNRSLLVMFQRKQLRVGGFATRFDAKMSELKKKIVLVLRVVSNLGVTRLPPNGWHGVFESKI